MPFQLWMAGPTLRINLSGHLTLEEILAVIAEVERLEAAEPIVPDRVTDLSALTEVTVTMDEMRHAAARRLATPFPNSFRSAFIAPETFQLGYARMFQILNDHPAITIRVFQSTAEADAWIGEP